jgi:hypothetical protein
MIVNPRLDNKNSGQAADEAVQALHKVKLQDLKSRRLLRPLGGTAKEHPPLAAEHL